MHNLVIEELYVNRFNTRHNINGHLPLLRHLARQCDHITEFGTDQGFSTCAFLTACPKRLVCYDVRMCYLLKDVGEGSLAEVIAARPKGTELTLREGDTLNIEIEPTDLLFIDTEHTYEQVAGELALHADKARKFIVLHDIVAFPCIVPAIREFLDEHKEWLVREWSLIQSGMAVLERIVKTEPATVTQGTEPEGY